MAETFVSPGVYVRERDFSYYVSSVGRSSLGLIGETQRGPAFYPTLVTNMGEFREKFGNPHPNMLAGYCAKSYFKYANSAYIVRVLGNDTLRENLNVIPIVSTGASPVVLATLLVSGTTASATTTAASATGDIPFTALGIYSGSINISDTGSPIYIETLFPRTNDVRTGGANALATQNVFPLAADGLGVSAITAQAPFAFQTGEPFDVSEYSKARTPVIVADATNGVTGQTQSLFTINTISDGHHANKEIKIAIENINTGTNKTFDVVVRDYSDTNSNPIILEKFAGVTMDKNATNYIAKQIGDSRDETLGDYALKSQYIYVTMEDNSVNQLKGLLPWGYNGIVVPFSGDVNFPEWTFTTGFVTTSVIAKQWLGLNYSTTDLDMLMHGVNSMWNLDGTADASSVIKGFHMNSTADTTYYVVGESGSTEYTKAKAKFLVPVLGGTDGWAYYDTPATRYLLSGTPEDDANYQTQWKAAIDDLANPEEYDINILAVPGVRIDHAIATYAKEMVETRADAIYVADMPSNYTTALQAGTIGSSVDSNYVCTYWPYVKIYDSDNEQDVWIPPTPQALEAMAYTDSVSYPWFAPAGLNRGLLTDVIRAKYRVTQDDREELYKNKINPIVTFPGQGISIWGQKTMQTRTTALDRINVRRMLLYVEKVIAGASKYLVFEQNDEATWDRFKALVQPVLDTVKIKRGLVDFRVIMDETTNTPEMIDRNQMVGQIYIKPTKTAEAILINFNILAQGATFEE